MTKLKDILYLLEDDRIRISIFTKDGVEQKEYYNNSLIPEKYLDLYVLELGNFDIRDNCGDFEYTAWFLTLTKEK